MIEIQNNNNFQRKNKNNKIKYEASKPSYLMPSNADKLLKNCNNNKSLNYSHNEQNYNFSSLYKKNMLDKKNNQRFNKNQNSVKKRINTNNKDKQSIEKKVVQNNIKSPKPSNQSPLIKAKIHKRINSLHLNTKENKKNLKPINNKGISNLKKNNYIDKKDNGNKNKNKKENSQNKKSNNINNSNYKIIEPLNEQIISSSNNMSFSSENKKSTKNENSNSINPNNYNAQLQIEDIEVNDMYSSFNKKLDNNSINNFSESELKQLNIKVVNQNSNNNNTLSGKIASRAKNLNKMLEDNFINLKSERKEKEKEEKNDEKKSDLSETINSKTIPINELVYNSINNNDKKDYNSIKLTRQKQNKLSSELENKKKNMQHKTASLNRSLQLRKKNKINENYNSDLNNKNHSGKKSMKVFSKSDFRQMNTSPFVKSKPPIKSKHTNYLAKKTSLKKNHNNLNVKSVDKKFHSPQKELNSYNDYISLELKSKNNNNKKTNFLSKKKVITKRKNKSMVLDNKINEKDISKINSEDNSVKSRIIKENNNKAINSGSNNKPINIKKPVRAQSQQEISSEIFLDNINDLLEKNDKKVEKCNDNDLKKAEKKILKLQSLCKKGFAGPGVKKTNQDNFFIYNNFNNNSNNIYMGVCDGHGMFGQDVSGYLVNTLPQNMNNILLNSNITSLSTESTIKLFPIILNTFVSTNIDMTEDDRVDSTFSGSTCVSLFYTPEKLICANVGDSRCVLGKFDGTNWKSKNLSRDQKPSEQDEYIRIINSGGRIESFKDENGNYIGPERVWLKDEDVPGLAMSRSFGDEVAHTVGVITEPEINEYFFLEEDKFIIIASDGLWEFISSDECVGMVKDFYLKNDIDGALNYLYKESSKRWIMEEEVIDDITILMAFLN